MLSSSGQSDHDLLNLELLRKSKELVEGEVVDIDVPLEAPRTSDMKSLALDLLIVSFLVIFLLLQSDKRAGPTEVAEVTVQATLEEGFSFEAKMSVLSR